MEEITKLDELPPWMPFFKLPSPEEATQNAKLMTFSEPILDIYCRKITFGEILLFAPLMNATPVRLTLLNNEENRRLAPLLMGLGLIRFADFIPFDTENIIPYRGVFFPKRLLLTFGLGKYSSIPKIKLLPSELAEAHDIISHYDNPVCIRDIQAQPTGDRDAPDGFFQHIVDSNPDHTFLSFGLNKDHPGAKSISKLRNVIEINDLSPRMMAACYYWAGKWVGPDCGPSYLMLAVHGKCDIFIPPRKNPQQYVPMWNCYPEDEWGEGENQTINYIRMNEKNPKSIIGLKYL